MGIVKKPITCSKPPEDYAGGATASAPMLTNNLSAHGMINPLSEDGVVDLLSANRPQSKRTKDKTISPTSSRCSAATTGRCGLGSWLAHKSGGTSEHWGQVTVVNVVFYILCVAAIGCSVYLNYRQSFVEERLRYMRHLDDRLTELESRLDNVFQQPLVQKSHHRRRVSPAINGFFSTTEKEFRAASSLALSRDVDSGEVEDDDESSEEFEDMKSVVRKLSLQVEGIQRLRRDVSHLKLTRQQRQTAIEQSPEDMSMCSCPPGKCQFQLPLILGKRISE